MIPVTRTDLSTVLANRPNTTPMIRGICTFVVFFSVSRPFCRFTLVCGGHFVLCYKETEPLDRAMASFNRSQVCVISAVIYMSLR